MRSIMKYGEGQVKICAFFASSLDESVLSASHSGGFNLS
jgi:hypothetical protein